VEEADEVAFPHVRLVQIAGYDTDTGPVANQAMNRQDLVDRNGWRDCARPS
jgi:hypothetical protein